MKRHSRVNPSDPGLSGPTQATPASGETSSSLARTFLWYLLVIGLLVAIFKLLDPLAMLLPEEDRNADAYAWWHVQPAADTARTTAPEPDQAEPEALRALKQSVADALLQGRFVKAMDLIRGHQSDPNADTYQTSLVALADYVAEVSRVNELVADAIRAKLDQEVVMRVKGNSYRLIPRAIAGYRLEAVLIPADPHAKRHSVVFSITDLDPEERAHWLGKATTPEYSAMKFLLLMHAGNPAAARGFAGTSGILAEAFTQLSHQPVPPSDNA